MADRGVGITGKFKNGSMIHPDFFRGCCFLCMQRGDYSDKKVLHKHHVFMGSLRKISEREGFFVWLCPDCHTNGENAVHRDYSACRRLQQTAQRAYERTRTREEFIRLFGRSYL